MKSMQLPLVAIWFMTYFYRTGGHDPRIPPLLKPYHMLKNLLELIALNGDGDGKKLGISTHTWAQGLMPTASAHLALAPMSHLVKL